MALHVLGRTGLHLAVLPLPTVPVLSTPRTSTSAAWPRQLTLPVGRISPVSGTGCQPGSHRPASAASSSACSFCMVTSSSAAVVRMNALIQPNSTATAASSNPVRLK